MDKLILHSRLLVHNTESMASHKRTVNKKGTQLYADYRNIPVPPWEEEFNGFQREVKRIKGFSAVT